MWDELMSCSNLPPRKECPWPVKSFSFNKCLLPIDKVPKYLTGEYRVDVEIMKGDETLGGYQIYLNIIRTF